MKILVDSIKLVGSVNEVRCMNSFKSSDNKSMLDLNTAFLFEAWKLTGHVYHSLLGNAIWQWQSFSCGQSENDDQKSLKIMQLNSQKCALSRMKICSSDGFSANISEILWVFVLKSPIHLIIAQTLLKRGGAIISYSLLILLCFTSVA